MGHIVNISGECKICGKKVEAGEEYCEEHKEFNDLDEADREDSKAKYDLDEDEE